MTAFNSQLIASRINARHSMQFNLLKLFLLAIALELFGRVMPAGILRAIFVLPPLILLPGFALITLAFGKSRPTDVAPLLIFSVGASFAVMAFNMLIMNAMGIRFSLLSLSLAELLTTDVIVAAVMFRAPMNAGLSKVKDTSRSIHAPKLMMRLSAIACSLIAGVALVFVVARHEPAPKSSPFTSLSTSSQLATLAKPISVTAGEPLSIPIIATSNGETVHKYSIVTTIGDRQVATQAVHLPKTGRWKGTVSVDVPSGDSLHRLVITLEAAGAKSSSVQLVMYLNEHA